VQETHHSDTGTPQSLPQHFSAELECTNWPLHCCVASAGGPPVTVLVWAKPFVPPAPTAAKVLSALQ
jgi:hypothetical protein